MPFNRALQAKTSGFQNNCGVNALIPKLFSLVKDGRVIEEVRQEILDNFNKYYGLTGDNKRKSFEELMEELEALNPLQREVVLGPVLRRLLPRDRKARNNSAPLGDSDVALVAFKFGLNTEYYCSWEAMLKEQEDYELGIALNRKGADLTADEIVQAKKVAADTIEDMKKHNADAETTDNQLDNVNVEQHAHPLGIVKLFNTGTHWEFEASDEAARDAHNRYYDETRSLYTDHEKRVRNAIRLGHQQPGVKLKDIFTRYEADPTANPNPGVGGGLGGLFGNGSQGIMQAFDQGFSMLGNLFGGQGNNSSAFSGIGDFFKDIFKFFFGFMTIAKKIGKEMNPAVELDEDDFQNHPMAQNYSEMVAKVAELDPRAAANLNRVWRTDTSPTKANAEAALLKALAKLGLNHEGDHFVQDNEDEDDGLSARWKAVQERYKPRGGDGPADAPAPGAAGAPVSFTPAMRNMMDRLSDKEDGYLNREIEAVDVNTLTRDQRLAIAAIIGVPETPDLT